MNIINRIDKETGLIIPQSEEKDFGQLDAFGHLRKNTLLAYQTDVSLFCYWLLGVSDPSNKSTHSIKMEMAQIGEILTSHRISERNIINFIQEFGFQYKLSSIYRKLAAITWALKETNKEVVTKSYNVSRTLKNLKNLNDKYRANQVTGEDIKNAGYYFPTKSPKELDTKQAPAMLLEHLTTIIDYLDNGEHRYSEINTLRLKTMILVWWHGAFRISEVAALRGGDVTFPQGGMKILTRNSKTDKNGEGLKKPFIYMANPRYCAINHLKQWLEFLGNQREGFIFKKLYSNDVVDPKDRAVTGRAFTNKLKELSKESGIKSINFQGHSPRRGFVTEAWNNGARGESIKIMGWKSNVWERYVDDMDSLENHPFKMNGQ